MDRPEARQPRGETERPLMLKSCSTALWDEYDVALLDLDGVVYVGRAAVPGAAEHLSRAGASGMHLAYVTNNASRPPSEVAEHLRELGIPATIEDVVTSCLLYTSDAADDLLCV